MGVGLARILHQLACKIAQEFDWLKDFPSERNNGVYFRGPLSPIHGLRGIWTSCPAEKILQAIKD